MGTNSQLGISKKAELQDENISKRPLPIKYKLDGGSPRVVASDYETRLAQMLETTGMENPLAGQHLLMQAFCTQPEQGLASPESGVKALNRQADMMHGIAPKNGLEGMLTAQMVATHNLGMEFAKRALEATHEKAIDANINRATKLQRSFVAQVDALNKLRRGGQQTIQVQHVQVNEGGQAVVGQKG